MLIIRIQKNMLSIRIQKTCYISDYLCERRCCLLEYRKYVVYQNTEICHLSEYRNHIVYQITETGQLSDYRNHVIYQITENVLFIKLERLCYSSNYR